MRDSGGDCWALWQGTGGPGVFGRPLGDCETPGDPDLQLSSAGSSVRQMDAAVSPFGALTTVFVRDDMLEGDGSVVGYSLFQPQGWLFGDGFETGTTSAWSFAVP